MQKNNCVEKNQKLWYDNCIIYTERSDVLNYIGSKLSLIDFIVDSIEQVSNKSDGVFADLFAGTGIVGSTFREKGFYVIANDIQHYSYVLNKHFIENSKNMNIDKSVVSYLNNLNGVDGFIYKNYCNGSGCGRNYFTDENGRKCDAIRIELDRLYHNKEINETQYYCLLAGLINSIDKCANTASVYGAFLKHIKKSAAKPFTLELLPVTDGKKGIVYNEDINNLITRISGDILYLDPPYNARQYCTNYHVLETISRYDSPTLSGKTGLREYSGQKSKYCSVKTVQNSFCDLISKANFKYIFLSYNNEGLMSLDTIREIMRKYGKYDVFTKQYHRFKADKEENRNHKAATTTEYLHCLTK